MKLVCSFYIGHSGYLDFMSENPKLDEAESRYRFTQEISHQLSLSLGTFLSEGQTLEPKNKESISSSLRILNKELSATEFGRETAVMDDEDGSELGFPTLLYVDAYFEIPSALEESIVEMDERGVLTEAIQECNLVVGEIVLPFEGVAELI